MVIKDCTSNDCTAINGVTSVRKRPDITLKSTDVHNAKDKPYALRLRFLRPLEADFRAELEAEHVAISPLNLVCRIRLTSLRQPANEPQGGQSSPRFGKEKNKEQSARDYTTGWSWCAAFRPHLDAVGRVFSKV